MKILKNPNEIRMDRIQLKSRLNRYYRNEKSLTHATNSPTLYNYKKGNIILTSISNESGSVTPMTFNMFQKYIQKPHFNRKLLKKN